MAVDDRLIQSIIDDNSLTNAEILDSISQIYMEDGFIITLRTDNQLQLIKKKKFSLFWAFLWLLCWGFGLLVYIFYYMAKKDQQINITLPRKDAEVQPFNPEKSSADDLVKLATLYEKGLLDKEEFVAEKNKILNR